RRPPPRPPRFPYTTLFRSYLVGGEDVRDVVRQGEALRRRPRLDDGAPGRLVRRLDVGQQPALEAAAQPFVEVVQRPGMRAARHQDRKSTRLNSSHVKISYA